MADNKKNIKNTYQVEHTFKLLLPFIDNKKQKLTEWIAL